MAAPGRLLTKKEKAKKAKLPCAPVTGATNIVLTQAPIIPVPIGSAAADKNLRLPWRKLAADPTMRAPNILPGKAKRLPVPMMFLIRLVVNAAPAAHKGPRSIPATTLIEC